MINPFKIISIIREHKQAREILERVGLTGDLPASLKTLAEMIVELEEREKVHKQTQAKADSSPDVVVSYFVPYDYEYSKYHNGGKVLKGTGMTVLNIDGSIRGWETVVGIQQHIAQRITMAHGAANPTVRINNITELSRWKKDEEPKFA